MQTTIDSKKKGDSAFRQKDFSMAIGCYSQVAFHLLIGFHLSCHLFQTVIINSGHRA
jgi:hypothetical protein